MFSSISNFIWGSTSEVSETGASGMECSSGNKGSIDDLSKMEVSNFLSSDEENNCVKSEDEWEMVAEEKKKTVIVEVEKKNMIVVEKQVDRKKVKKELKSRKPKSELKREPRNEVTVQPQEPPCEVKPELQYSFKVKTSPKCTQIETEEPRKVEDDLITPRRSNFCDMLKSEHEPEQGNKRKTAQESPESKKTIDENGNKKECDEKMNVGTEEVRSEDNWNVVKRTRRNVAPSPRLNKIALTARITEAQIENAMNKVSRRPEEHKKQKCETMEVTQVKENTIPHVAKKAANIPSTKTQPILKRRIVPNTNLGSTRPTNSNTLPVMADALRLRKPMTIHPGHRNIDLFLFKSFRSYFATKSQIENNGLIEKKLVNKMDKLKFDRLDNLKNSIDDQNDTMIRRIFTKRRTRAVEQQEQEEQAVPENTDLDPDILLNTTERRPNAFELYNELRGETVARKIKIRPTLTRKSLEKSNVVRAVASAGNGRRRRADMNNPRVNSRCGNNRKMH